MSQATFAFAELPRHALPPSVRGSATSIAAAVAIAPHIGRLQQVVLDYIRSCGSEGCTDEQIIDATGLSPSSARPRRVECVEKGLVCDSGRVRLTRSGRSATVWIAKE